MICLSILRHNVGLVVSSSFQFSGEDKISRETVASPAHLAIQGTQSERVRHLTGSLGDEIHVEYDREREEAETDHLCTVSSVTQ